MEVEEGTRTQSEVPLKPLLSIRGYLIYVVRTFDYINPYLKGLHNTIDGWRPNYDEDGWKMTGRRLLSFRREQEYDSEDEEGPEESAPDRVEVKPRLRRDIEALLELTRPEEPPRRVHRSRRVIVGLYLPGDASGSGFGSALIWQDGIEYESGTWKCQWTDKSSNLREADNLVRKIEDLVERGLRGAYGADLLSSCGPINMVDRANQNCAQTPLALVCDATTRVRFSHEKSSINIDLCGSKTPR
ncbi:hypothetical protein THAOC_32566, partial [Thalassiosira oceanica]